MLDPPAIILATHQTCQFLATISTMMAYKMRSLVSHVIVI